MSDYKNTGRFIGLAMMVSFVVGMVSNFKLQSDLFVEGGLIVNAAAHSDKIGMIALLGLLTGLVSTFAAALVSTSLRQRAPVLVTGYFAIVIAGLAISMLEYSSLIAFRSLSEAYVSASADKADSFHAAKVLLVGLRDGIHYLDKLLGGTGVLILFAIFYRLRLIPRALAAFGILAVLSQMFTVGRALFGHDVIYLMLAPISLAFLVTMIWLLIKGFAEEGIDGSHPPVRQAPVQVD
ncbi:DUF4386 domain-containing protein [Pseudoxanthomonas sp. CF125]|uniref:DUF4386 domain-containing protein n=1 Tax=Pseudoxanthomonas sp. CF125 TaxID=1855303 RepID=UPI0008831B4E|nr:DUF4386 domain-containing protein [Pseudoxanthomonas sp. CF125]SDQ81709.1 protein of unknown function [Pseudoxanthomonas sp. CF125]